jgi:D-alanyl-D-alanine carboxypeptidase
MQTMIPVAAKGFMKKIQIASISKIMTCYLSLLVCKKYGIDSKKCQVKITL